MKLWVIGLGLAFLYTAHATYYDFEKCDPDKLPRTWFTQIFATNSSMLSDYLDDMSMVEANITTTKDGSFRVSSSVPTPYGCLKMDIDFTRREDGLYSCNNEYGEGVILDAKTDCKTYCVVVALHERDGSKYIFLTLYGVEKIPTEKSKRIFANLFQKIGLEEKYLVQFPPEVACTE